MSYPLYLCSLEQTRGRGTSTRLFCWGKKKGQIFDAQPAGTYALTQEVELKSAPLCLEWIGARVFLGTKRGYVRTPLGLLFA